MKLYGGLLIVSLLVTAGCGDGDADKKGLGEQVGDAISDTQLMREASAAVNQITRNAADCDAVRSSIDDVNRKLDEVGAKIQTNAGKTTLETLRKQAKRVAEACGVI